MKDLEIVLNWCNFSSSSRVDSLPQLFFLHFAYEKRWVPDERRIVDDASSQPRAVCGPAPFESSSPVQSHCHRGGAFHAYCFERAGDME